MAKNGLFLISIGLLLFMASTSPYAGSYDFLSMTTAVFCIGIGSWLLFKAKKKPSSEKNF